MVSTGGNPVGLQAEIPSISLNGRTKDNWRARTRTSRLTKAATSDFPSPEGENRAPLIRGAARTDAEKVTD